MLWTSQKGEMYRREHRKCGQGISIQTRSSSNGNCIISMEKLIISIALWFLLGSVSSNTNFFLSLFWPSFRHHIYTTSSLRSSKLASKCFILWVKKLLLSRANSAHNLVTCSKACVLARQHKIPIPIVQQGSCSPGFSTKLEMLRHWKMIGHPDLQVTNT